VTSHDHSPDLIGRNQHTALLLDVDDLIRLLQGRGFVTPARVLRGLLQRLYAYLKHRGVQDVTRIIALGDFDQAGEGVQRTLVLHGIEAIHVPRMNGTPDLCAMQLGVEATALAHSTSDISTVILAVGRLVYLPLVQQLQRAGLRVLLVWDRDQVPGDLVMNVGRDAVVGLFEPTFVGHRRLEEPLARRSFPLQVRSESHGDEDEEPVVTGESGNGYEREVIGKEGGGDDADVRVEEDVEDRMPDVRDEPMVGEPITSEHEIAALRTLLTSFGRHAEVFLTPYLFKLNAILPDLERFERKAVVMRLEEACAVRVERRRGVPNDYSVIIVNYNHPTVREILG